MAIDNNLNTMYAMDRGIDRVVYGTQVQPNLPDKQLLEPTDAATSEVDPLLAPPSLSDSLDEAIAKPAVSRRDITLPAKFSEALNSALNQLQKAADAADQPENEKTLKRAVRLVAEEMGHRELVQMYRTALYQG